MAKTSDRPALFIGIDWAMDEHVVCTVQSNGEVVRHQKLRQNAETIEAWLSKMQQEADGGVIAIAVEQGRGGLIHALMFRENVHLYIVNPHQLTSYRKSFSHAGCKNDTEDATLLARMLFERWSQLKKWVPDDEDTRLLREYCRRRRQLVDDRTRLIQRLIEELRSYFPAILELFPGKTTSPIVLALLKRWPNPQRLIRADRQLLHRVLKAAGCANKEKRTQLVERLRNMTLLSRDRALLQPAADFVKFLVTSIEQIQKTICQFEKKIATIMKSHKDARLFEELPGAGAALAPRLLVAFGSQRDRYESAEQLLTFSGIAPVTKQSGKSKVVHHRYARPKFLHQTFVEFAEQARRWCPWSRAYYGWLRDRGMQHNAILRKLASRWIRILFRCWKTSTPYSSDHYIRQLYAKNPDIVPYLKQELSATNAA